MTYRALTYLGIGLSCGCAGMKATPADPLDEQYSAMCNSWIGAEVRELLAQWGPPSVVFTEPNGNTLYEWDEADGQVVDPDSYDAAKDKGAAVCATRMAADDNHKIVEWWWDGDCQP